MPVTFNDILKIPPTTQTRTKRTVPQAKPKTSSSGSSTQTQQVGLSEADLRRIGYTDPNVIRNILNNPNERARYERELGIGTGGGQPGDPLQEVNSLLENSFQNLQNEVLTRYGQYRADNPFNLDEVLAQKTAEAKEQIDPYYNETLSDYLLGVTRKIERGARDTNDLLSELSAQSDSFQGEAKFKLTEAISRAQEGKAEAGLFSSGERLRQEGLAQAQTGNTLQDFLRQQQFKKNTAQLGLSDFMSDIELDKKQKQRDIERERLTAVETRKNQLAREAGQNYVTGFRATLPTQLQAQSGFDLLGDLGLS